MIHGTTTSPLTPQEDQRLPLVDRAVYLISAPAITFADVDRTPPTPSNWLAPMILFVLVSIFSIHLLFNNPSLSGQFKAAVLEQLTQAVESGTLTEEEAERQYERFGPGSVLFTIASFVGLSITPFVTLFALGLVYWLIGRSAMAASAPYMKVIEVVGLTYLVGTLESIVATVLMLMTESIYATPSMALLVLADFDVENLFHLTLSKLNVFTLWILYLTSMGLSQLYRRDFPKVLVLILSLWFLWILATLFVAVGF
ncbi:MAG: hypothetical protein WBG01_18330 [Bacteroidota bacterium]